MTTSCALEAQESGVTIKRLEHLNEWEAVQKEIPDDYYRDSIVEMLKRPEENLSSPPFVSFVQNGQYDEFDAWIRNRNVTVSQKKCMSTMSPNEPARCIEL